MYINRIHNNRAFILFNRKETVAAFSYNNSGNYDGRDARKLDNSLAKVDGSNKKIPRLIGMDHIALTVVQALEINEVATIDIMHSFDKSSWDMKAKALVALHDMCKQYEEKNALEENSPEDGVMETKLRALAAYQEIMNEISVGIHG